MSKALKQVNGRNKMLSTLSFSLCPESYMVLTGFYMDLYKECTFKGEAWCYISWDSHFNGNNYRSESQK